jgi:hypothetical protein
MNDSDLWQWLEGQIGVLRTLRVLHVGDGYNAPSWSVRFTVTAAEGATLRDPMENLRQVRDLSPETRDRQP